MVFESFTSPFRAAKKPSHMFFIGCLYATIAVFLSLWLFKQYASLVMVFLTVVAAVPLMYKTMKMEERFDTKTDDEGRMLREHARVLESLVFLFIGFVVIYTLFFIASPPGIVEQLFSSQVQTIEAINSRITGQAFSSMSIFGQIFQNNVKVLMFCLFFSFFYGAGAIFILTWNASVISAAIGDFIRNKVAAIAVPSLFSYFYTFPLGLLRYFIHGIPEIAAYFLGGLAGGIISVAMINHDLESKHFKNIFIDAIDLILLAIFVLVVAGLIEVYITPVFF